MSPDPVASSALAPGSAGMSGRKILFLVSAMVEGGAERVAANLAGDWSSRGNRVTLVATFSGRGGCHYVISPQVRLLYLADMAGVVGRGPWAYLRRYLALRRLIRSERPDVIVSFLTNVNVAAVAGALGTGIPVIVSERIYPPAYPVGRATSLLRRLLYPVARRVVLQTPESLRWLQDEIPSARGVVIPNPVSHPVACSDPRVPPEAVVPNGKKLLLGVGRLHSQKGFDLLLSAFALVAASHPDWILVIVGEGPERRALEAQAMRLKLTGRCFFPGHLGNMHDWYGRADLYVLSSRFEGFPNSLAEAMAYGCAVVSYDCDSGPRDLIRTGENGVLASPVGDVAQLRKAIEELMRSDSLRSRLGAGALDVRENFSANRVLAMWDELFNEVSPGQ